MGTFSFAYSIETGQANNLYYVSWLRRYDNRSPVVIVGAEELDYQLTLDDVEANLLLMYTPVTLEGVKGEPHFATTAVVHAGDWMLLTDAAFIFINLLS